MSSELARDELLAAPASDIKDASANVVAQTLNELLRAINDNVGNRVTVELGQGIYNTVQMAALAAMEKYHGEH